MEQQLVIQNLRKDTWSSDISAVEFAEDNKRAVLRIPLMHVGANKKGLYWTPEMLRKIAPMFQAVPFRYDLDGQEGSSHTTRKLSSPHFDVGWTYKDDKGSIYDEDAGTIWVSGEVTHPQVLSKLSRTTSDGQREINFASMGVIVEEAKCNICGADFKDVACDNGHERMKPYNGDICYKIATEVSKALHVALTNDPADGEADIAECIFQEMGGFKMQDYGNKFGINNNNKLGANDNKFGPNKEDNKFGASDNNKFSAPNSSTTGTISSNQMSPNDLRDGASTKAASTDYNQIPGGLAPSSPQTEQPGMAPSPQDILKDLAERIKTIESKVSASAMESGSPELVNVSPQDQFTQDNMGTTTQPFGNTEEKNMTETMKSDPGMGQATNEKTDINPAKAETQEMGMDMGAILQEIHGMLKQLLGNNGSEMQDMNKEAQNATKGEAVDHHNPKVAPTEHADPGDSVGDDTDEGAKKNRAHMNEPGMVATAEDEVSTVKKEMADMNVKMGALMKKLEIQDSEIPEFGGQTTTNQAKVEVANMGASGRTENFGEYGAWDSIFNGADSAIKFKR